MTDPTNHPPVLPNPAVDAARALNALVGSRWWGVAALASAVIVLLGAVISAVREQTTYGLNGDDSFDLGNRIVLLANSLTTAASLLIVVALLVGPADARRTPLAATAVFVLALVVAAVSTQRHLG
ncbi:MAG: hypothetical protein JWN72_352 [Thermoleophilia bacterium]|nr:hypothetical protein [Thermoleophilia bacterium]